MHKGLVEPLLPHVTQVVLGKIRTMRTESETADALAWAGGRVVAVGSSAAVLAVAGPDAEVITLPSDCCVIPGFVDPHVHLDNRTTDPQLDQCKTKAELLAQLRERLTQRTGPFLRCQVALDGPAVWPSLEDLDALSSEIPIAVTNGFTWFVNSRALQMGGVDRWAPDPLGGRIWKRPDGSLTGMLSDYAVKPLEPIFGTATDDAIKKNLRTNVSYMASHGVTTVHQMVKHHTAIQTFSAMYAAGELPLRVGFLINSFGHATKLESLLNLGISNGFGNEWLKIQGVKFILDGGIPNGMALHEEPAAACGCGGVFRTQPELLQGLVETAHRAGLRCCVHANGDRAIDITLDIFESVLTRFPVDDHRHRIEHAGNLNCSPERIDRMRRLGIVAVPNPPFLFRKLNGVRSLLPDRYQAASVNIQDFLDRGAHVAVGSDYPGLYPVAPLENIARLVRRASADSGSTKDNSNQNLTNWDAVRLYTVVGAWLGFEEHIKGKLLPGYLADFVVLSADPVTADPIEIRGAEVIATVVGGSCTSGSLETGTADLGRAVGQL